MSLIASASRRTPSSIRALGTDENESRNVRSPDSSRKNAVPGVNPTPRWSARGSSAFALMPSGSVISSENPPCGSVQVTS